MSKTIGMMADEILETIAREDNEDFQRRGFYTTKTRAGECKVLIFDWPEEQKQLDEFNRRQKNEQIQGKY